YDYRNRNIPSTWRSPNMYKALLLFSLLFSASVAHAANCLTLETYGGAGNGTTDNSAAYGSAMSAIGTSNGCISFGPGTYRFNSNGLSKTLAAGQAMTLRGAGAESTILLFPNAGDGLSFTYTNSGQAFVFGSALTVSDMSFTTAQAPGGSAVTVHGNGNA